MRTTIEITQDHRARLIEMATRRGEKGFSSIVREALDAYFQNAPKQDPKIRKALGALGTLSEEDADALQETVTRLRSSWR